MKNLDSLDILWENVNKIWTTARSYELEEVLEESDEIKKVIFSRDKNRALVIVTTESVAVQDVRRILEEAEELNCNQIMIATIDKVTTTALKEGKSAGIEFIHRREPLIYIFDHYLVPEHRILSKAEAKEVVMKYANGKKGLLPKILSSDPAVRILGAKPGDIIEIRRKVPSLEELIEKYGKEFGKEIYEKLRELTPAGEEVFYRIVIEEAEEYSF